MNAIQTTVRFFLLLSFAVSGAACSGSTLQAHNSYLDARLDRADALDRLAGRTAHGADARIALAR